MASRLPLLFVLMVVILGFAAIGSSESALVDRFVIDTLIKLVLVIGLWAFIGTSGVLSFGHIGFAMIGAYGAAWFTLPVNVKQIFLPQLPEFVLSTHLGLAGGALIGVLLAAVSALLIGIAVMRLSGIGASIATLAWLVIVYTVYSNADALTKGTSSLVGLPMSTTLSTAATCALLALVVAFLFRYSRFGLMLAASREDEAAAFASGIPVRVLRLAAFVISAAIVALGGVLQGHFLGILSVGQFYIGLTFLTLAMLVVGGMKSLAGAVAGTILLSVVAELLRITTGGFSVAGIQVQSFPGLREIGLAAIMLVILLWRPQGLLPSDDSVLLKLRVVERMFSRPDKP